ncbi:MAG: DUF5667 domain-containing protein [bacterium]
MNDKELFKKLNNLKTIRPDDDWKKTNREILYSQISAGHFADENKSESNLKTIWHSIMAREVLMNMAKPAWVSLSASVLILIIGVGGVYSSKNSKPGDSLYIAKIISEKAQMAITFNEKDKAKLGLEFATSRAKEMAQVLEQTEKSGDGQNKKVEQLSQNFKKEISQVKSRLTTIQSAEIQNKEEEPEVFGANLGKNGQRMEIAESVKIATTTEEKISSPDKVLEEAEKLFDEKNYGGTINKIEEAKQIMDKNTDNGEVKGVSETASSTINN